nr:unnamed protein product [Callosobruchus chinensis]
MLSILKTISYLSDSASLDKNAIVLVDDQNVLESKSYRVVFGQVEVLSKVLREWINENTCLGLFMYHNTFLPSIIISLQMLKHSFVFLTHKSAQALSEKLKLKWILSLDDTVSVEQFEQVKKIEIDDCQLFLWKKVHNDVLLDFEGVFCIMQTSGSTGDSKIVRVTHECIEINANSLRKKFNIQSEDHIFWGTPLTFDPALIEFLIAFLSGATLIIVPQKVYLNPAALYKALFTIGKITFLQMVPSIFLRWDDKHISLILACESLKTLVFGGEVFPKIILQYQRSKNLSIFNIYGITEVSCWATLHKITDETFESMIPLGTCLNDTALKVDNENDENRTLGGGEIFIGSSTRICYIDDENPKNLTGTIYRATGDIGKVSEKGVYFISRKNKIIKRFGQKINLGTIENIIFDKTGLINKCVWSQEHNRLLNFIVIEGKFDPEYKKKMLDKIRVKVISFLPENSVPDFIEVIEKLPLTSHGKVDEKSLEKLYCSIQLAENCNFVEVFSELWSKYLGISAADLERYKEYKFFETGGSSIKALQLLSEFKEVTNSDYPDELLTAIFEKRYMDCLECFHNFSSKRQSSHENLQHIYEKRTKVAEEAMKVMWKYDLKACVDATPLAFENENEVYIAVGAFSHIFVVLDERGAEIYKETFPDAIEGQPLLSNQRNTIFIGCFDGVMYCIDFIRKETVWKYKTGDRIKSTPSYCRSKTAIVFGSYDKVAYCLSENGDEIWKTTLDGSITSNPTVDIKLEKIFITTVSGSCFCLKECDGTVRWRHTYQHPIFSSPCLSSDKTQVLCCYVKGTVFSLAVETGHLLWSYKTDNFIFSSPVLLGDYVTFGSIDKHIYFFKILPDGCELVAKTELDSRITSTSCIVHQKDKVFVVSACNSGKVSIIDSESHSVIRSVQLQNEVFSSPVFYRDKIYIGCRDNNIYCLSID